MMHVDIIHRNARWVGGADYMSRKGGNIWFDPLISKHQTLAATLRKKYAAPIGTILAENLPGYQAPRTPASSNHVSTVTMLDDE